MDYNKNTTNSKKNKHLTFQERYFIEIRLKDKWSLDACFGDSITNNRFQRSEMVCTKTLYSYVDLGFMNVKSSELSIKLRINKKKELVD